MGYFDSKKNVEDYIQMVDGYDGREMVKILNRFLTKGSSVLEIGMGPGKDIPFLEKEYEVTGTDFSQVFVDLYLKNNPQADIFKLDAITMDTARKFDCVYSNKVLHSISREDFKTSLANQMKVLNPSGLMFHTLWYGDKEIEVKSMKFWYYTEKTILNYLPAGMEIVHQEVYQEMDTDDSFLIILKRK